VIHTVLGPIDPRDLGPTSMHEHLFIDCRLFHDPRGVEDLPESEAVALDNIGLLRWNWAALLDNLIVDDTEMLGDELDRFGAHGGSGLVDMTNIGLGRRVAELPALAARTGVHIMIGSGWYLDATHSPEVRASSPEDLSVALCAELTDGVGDTGIIPAIIGEIGTSAPVTESELRVLLASGLAAVQTGAAVNVHTDSGGSHGVQIVEVLLSTGMPVDRIVLSHMDENLDVGYHRDVAATGAVLEYDTFGAEHYWGYPPVRDPTDLERIDAIATLVDEGYSAQLVLGCDVFIKTQHRRFGGMGYEHLPRRIAPLLRERGGIASDDIRRILVDNPRRLLDRPSSAP
jgi:phosphotriesterase-related protein